MIQSLPILHFLHNKKWLNKVHNGICQKIIFKKEHLYSVPSAFCNTMIAVNSAEFAGFMISLDFGKITGKSAFSGSFSNIECRIF